MGKVLGMDLPWRLEDWGEALTTAFSCSSVIDRGERNYLFTSLRFICSGPQCRTDAGGIGGDPETRNPRDNNWDISLLPILPLDLGYERKP